MTHPSDPLPRAFPDASVRASLCHPANLRAFLGEAVPDLAAAFDCDRARLLDREFPLDDWRGREADLPFEVPYRLGGDEVWALVFLLIEHQSDTDPLMPFRLLYFVVLYWERQWRAWQQLEPPRPPLRLNPVLPIVLYTGETPWGSNRTLRDLLGEPQALHGFAPAWAPLYWNLADRTPESLLASPEAWLQVLAVARARSEPWEVFEPIYQAALRRLDGLSEAEQVRWYDLLRMALGWALHSRPAAEHAAVVAAARASQGRGERQKEVETMTQTIAEALIAQGVAKGMAKGREEGREEGQLLHARAMLLRLLARRFGTVPEELGRRIQAATYLQRLSALMEQVSEFQSLEDMAL